MINNVSFKNNRIKWIDLAKGTTILLVICGHTIGNYYVRTLIFSFHMPLFYILSGYTYKHPNNWKDYSVSILKSLKRLVLPAYLIWIIRNILYYFVNDVAYTPAQYILQGLYASGTQCQLKEIIIPAYGMMWFLVSLFTVRTIYGLFILLFKDIKFRMFLSVLLCCAGIYIGNNYYLPLSFDISLVAIIFFQFGTILKQPKSVTKHRIACIVAPLIWVVVIMVIYLSHDNFELAARLYPYGFLSILMAIAASYCIIQISKKVSSVSNIITEQLINFGKNSMLMFFVHAFDTVWYPQLLKLENTLIVLIVRMLIDIMFFYFVLKIKEHIHDWRYASEVAN